jgi:hypothetical protein
MGTSSKTKEKHGKALEGQKKGAGKVMKHKGNTGNIGTS